MLRRSFFILLLCISSVFSFQNHISLVDNVFYSRNYESCSDNPLIEITHFSGKYYHKELLMEFEMSGKSSVDDKIMITFLFTVHEKRHIKQTYDPCVIKIPGLCSIVSTPYFLTKGVLPLSAEESNVPEFFFNIPDFQGEVYFYFHSAVTGKELGCLKTDIVNKQSFHNNIITWICLGFLGLSAFTSFMAFSSQSSFSYALLAASHSIPGLLTFWSYFQFLATIAMENVVYPTSLIAWASNFSFSLGLIEYFQELIYLFNKFAEKHIHLSLGNAKGKENNINFSLSNSHQGIQGQLNYLKIANTNAFIISIICFVSAVIGFLIISTIVCFITRIIRRNEIFIRRNWMNFNLLSILRLVNSINTIKIYLLFQLVINVFGISFISIYQLALHDAYQPKILSAFSLLIFVVPILILSLLHFFRSHFRRLDSEMTAKYWGWLIVEYNSKKQHFYLVFLTYSLCKAILLGLFNFPSKSQTISLSIVELLHLLSILILFPFESIRAYILELLLGAIKTSCLGIIITFSFNISELLRALLGMTIIMISTIGLLTLFIFTLWNFIIVSFLAITKDHINHHSFKTNTLSDKIHNYKQKVFKQNKFGKVFGYDQYLYPEKQYYTYSSQSSNSTAHNSEQYYIKQYQK